MAQLRRHFRLFVASPGDMQAERERVPQVVKRVNDIIGADKGIHLESWSWDMDAAPDAGHPQDVINRQLDQSDIVVVIIWSRMGTPTNNAASGTAEEFFRALKRWESTGWPRIMVYYCERPMRLDITLERIQQLNAVANFKEQIAPKVLGQKFESTDDFEQKLLQHLLEVSRDLVSAPPPPSSQLSVEDNKSKVSLEPYLDQVESVCGSIVLTGLLSGKAAPAVPLEEVYVSLTVTRPDLLEETNSRGAYQSGVIAALANDLRQRERIPEAPEAETKKMLEAALREVGVSEQESQDAYTIKSAYHRLRTDAGHYSSQSVREILRTFQIEDAFRYAQYLLVEGVPGSGKTTILMRVAMALVKAHRGDPESAQSMGFAAPYPLPIFVPLRRFATYLRSLPIQEQIVGGSPPLLKYLCATVLPYIGEDDWLITNLEAGHVTLLFDGLDEVTDDVVRHRVAGIVRDFIRKYSKCRIVLTTRPAGLTAAVRNTLIRQGRLAFCEVRPLDQEQMSRFIGAWYRALNTDHQRAQQLTRDLVKRIEANPRVAELARSPILLTAIAVVHQTLGDIPERRADLYEHCVRALCGRWDAAKDEEGRELCGPVEQEDKIILFEQIAFTIHGQGGDAKTIERGPLLNILSKTLPSDPKQAFAPERYSPLLDNIVDRTGLIIPDGDITYRFRHLSFQEYLAARHISARYDHPVEALAPQLADPWWREVVLLAPAYKAMFSGPDARQLLLNLAEYARVNPDPDFRATAFGTLAHALLDLREYKVNRLEETASELRADFLSILTDLAQHGEPKTRAEIAECLGFFGDPRLTDKKRWVTVPAGAFRRGSAAKDAARDEISEGTIQINEFHVQRWLTTINEYRIFVEDAKGYTEQRWWDPEGWHWFREETKRAPAEWETQVEKSGNLPVGGISWWEAQAYCRWYSTIAKGQPDKWIVRLPTEAEWEKAARGGETLAAGVANEDPEREYPWLGPWNDNLANSSEGNWLATAAPVGCYTKGNGAYGTWDQAGNIWEWCLDWYDPQAYHRPGRVNPAVIDQQSVPKVPTLNGRQQRVIAPCRVSKGGSWTTDARQCRVGFRNRLEPSRRLEDQGFRCVVAPPLSLK